MFGDKWSLLVIRDVMVRGYRTFKEFQSSGEGIATNILADRLAQLTAAGIVCAEKDPKDGRRVEYQLTEKGIDLAPVLLELLVWGARHEKTGAPPALVEQMIARRTEFLAEVRRRWEAGDRTPLIPSFKKRREP
jgi:DNA-binding HxlR family transcriptional regulator